MTSIHKITICGAGTMGSGIAQVFAAKNFEVLLYDVNAEMLTKAQQSISAALNRLVDKKKITEAEKTATLANLQFSGNREHCHGDLIIEAIIEKLETKCELIDELFKINGPETIIVTNTSSLSVTKIAENISAPGRFGGMHFFNPAPLMKLVEIIKTDLTSRGVVEQLIGIVKQIGKTPVLCKDSPGFIVNRVARPYYLEALHLLENEQIDISAIDKLMEVSGFPMGPFKLMDLIGNDINFSVTKIVYDALGNPERLKPSIIQERNVNAGMLGRKSGKGFYDYPS